MHSYMYKLHVCNAYMHQYFPTRLIAGRGQTVSLIDHILNVLAPPTLQDLAQF